MADPSATKKILIDLGIKEEHAHKLADNRKWAIMGEGLYTPVSLLSQEDILHIVYGRTEAYVDEWWIINDIHARIQGLKEIEVPTDLGIVNHGKILTIIHKIGKKPKKFPIHFTEEVK